MDLEDFIGGGEGKVVGFAGRSKRRIKLNEFWCKIWVKNGCAIGDDDIKWSYSNWIMSGDALSVHLCASDYISSFPFVHFLL